MTKTETTAHASAATPAAPPSMAPTSLADCDAAIAELAARADDWAELPIPARSALLERLRSDTALVAAPWVAAACRAKRIAPAGPLAGEEWSAGPYVVLRYLRLLADALRDIAEHGSPRTPAAPYARPDGQVVAPVFPAGLIDRLTLPGFSAEVWMCPEVGLDDLPDTQAHAYRGRAEAGVELVLGAGNVASIPLTDALDKLFVAGHVVVLKMNPVNDYLGPYFGQAMRAVVEAGFLRIVYGGADVGAHLLHHRDVTAVHVTGSNQTYDAMVFGEGEEGERRKAERRPLLRKPVTAELGNVTPVIVVPGPWADRDLAFHGENVASMLTNNAGFNCIAARVVLTHEAWPARAVLLDEIRSSLRRGADRVAYYPGAKERLDRYLAAHPDAERYGGESPDTVPWAFVPGLDAADRGEPCFSTEAFCGLLSEVALDAPSPAAFLDAAVDFANTALWGNLAVTLIVHPCSLRDPGVKAAVDRAVAALRYGTVVVNHWSGLSFALGTTAWGAFRGDDGDEMVSGRGVVHNALMFDRSQKTVLRGPFRVAPKPMWFASNANQHEIARRLALLEAAPTLTKVPGLVRAALKG